MILDTYTIRYYNNNTNHIEMFYAVHIYLLYPFYYISMTEITVL